MDERFRKKQFNDKDISYQSVYFEVVSSNNIYLKEDTIYLRGTDKSEDAYIAYHNFTTKKQALEYKEKVIQSLKDWSENWEGFKEDKKKDDESGDVNHNIYEF